MGTWKNKKWRRLMKFVCQRCHKERKTMSHDRKEAKVCLLCEKNKIPENQKTIFDYPISEERFFSK